MSDTMRKGIVDVTAYNGSEALLMVGSLSALTGSCIIIILKCVRPINVQARWTGHTFHLPATSVLNTMIVINC